MPPTVEAPNVARVNERHEWEYGQMQHHAALKNIRGAVDQSKPSSIDPQTQQVQSNTRRFNEDQKRAQIGRENRKMVEKLETIAKGMTSYDPRAPPSKEHYRKVPGPFTVNRAATMRTSESWSPSSQRKVRSLNEAHRHKVQRDLDHDNASLVRRILSVGSTFDRKVEAKDFSRHKRAVNNLQRYSDRSSQQVPPRALPPLRAPRPTSHLGMPARDLEAFFTPWEIRRSGTSPAALLDVHTAELSISPTFDAVKPSESEDTNAPAESPSNVATTDGAEQPHASSTEQDWGMDYATERRSWLQEDAPPQGAAPVQNPPPSSTPPGEKTTLGLTQDSDVGYSADWDDNSMSGTPAGTQGDTFGSTGINSKSNPMKFDFGKTQGSGDTFGSTGINSKNNPMKFDFGKTQGSGFGNPTGLGSTQGVGNSQGFSNSQDFSKPTFGNR